MGLTPQHLPSLELHSIGAFGPPKMNLAKM